MEQEYTFDGDVVFYLIMLLFACFLIYFLYRLFFIKTEPQYNQEKYRQYRSSKHRNCRHTHWYQETASIYTEHDAP